MRCVGADDVPQRMDLFVRRPALLLLVNRYFRVKRSTTWCAELRFWRDHDLQNNPRDVCFQAEAKRAATADMRAQSSRPALSLATSAFRPRPSWFLRPTFLSVRRWKRSEHAFDVLDDLHAGRRCDVRLVRPVETPHLAQPV